jgi:hypothetical protein
MTFSRDRLVLMRVARLWPLLVSIALLLSTARAGAEDKKPDEVTVGVYVNQIHELSLKENFFVADFYVWFRWANEALKPYDTFSVIDGRIESKGEVVQKKLPGGASYAYLRIVARITKFWNTRDYPFDDHTISVVIEEEEGEDNLLTYVADRENSGADPRIAVPGWKVARTGAGAESRTYKSNFGDVSLPTGKESRYTRLTLDLSLEREGKTYFFKLFFGLWVAAAISFLSFFIKPTDVDPRFGLGVGAIFAAIASEYVVTGALPDANLVTLADKLHLVAFAFIYLVLAQSTISLWLTQNGREEASKRLDRQFGLVVPVLYTLMNVVLVVRR